MMPGSLSNRFTALRPNILALSVAACFAASAAWALPTGSQVAAGAAKFNQSGNSLVVTNTPGTIINWSNFSIGAQEAVRFKQQNSLSSVLNRVTGSSSSSILGSLLSNGRVFLINPNGVLFGPNSQVDVQGLVVSTLGMSDSDFRKGKLNFAVGTAGAGRIENSGTLAASQNIYLVGPDIENSGIIRSAKGEILLAAGRQVTLVDAAHPDIQVVVSAPDDKAVNIGEIAAGKISVFGSLIQQKGRVNADRVEVDDHGRIVFRATQQLNVEAGSLTTANGPTGGSVSLQTTGGDTYVSGQVEAKGNIGAGGTAQVLGQRVAIMDNALIDVSGETDGGKILVGGDYQGKNPAIQNAQVTYFGSDATLKANAGKVGAGGTAIVWADDTTRAYGSIEARGGSKSGNGGFVETSGRRFLDVLNAPDTSAVRGNGGTWLLDPENIDISGSSSNNIAGAGPLFQPATSGSSTLNDTTLINYLVNTGDVIVDTTCSSACGSGGLITVSTPINPTLTTPRTLTLNAHGGITLNESISATGDILNVVLNADQLNTGTGTLTVAAAKTVATNGGNVTIHAADIALSGTINAGSGAVAITASAGLPVVLGNTFGGFTGLEVSGSELQNITAANLTLTTGRLDGAGSNRYLLVDGISSANSANIGNVTLEARWDSASSIQNSDISFANNPSTFNALDVKSQSGIYVKTNVTSSVGDMAFYPDINASLNYYDGIGINGSVTLTSAGLLNLAGYAEIGTGFLTGAGFANGNVSLVGNGITLNGWNHANATGYISSFNSGSGSLTQTAAITAASLTVVNAGTATLNNSSNAISNLSASGSGSLEFKTSTPLNIVSISKPTTYALLTANGAITQNGAISANVLDATSNNSTITLNDNTNSVNTFKGDAYGSITYKNNGAFIAHKAKSATGSISLINAGSGNISTDGDSYGIEATDGNISVTGNLDNYGHITIGSTAFPVHTLTVTGNFTQDQMGGITVYGSSPSSHGAVNIGGTASLDGSLSISGSPSVGNYAVFSAASVSGTFGSLYPSGATATASGGTVTIAVPVPSTAFIWDGNSDADGDGTSWTDPYNWNLDSSYPGSLGGVSNADVTIGSTYTATISTNLGTITSLGGLGTISFGSGGSLTISGTSNTFQQVSMAGGTLNVPGNLILSSFAMTGGALQGGGISGASNTFTVNDSFSQTAGNIAGFNAVHITQSSSGLTVGNISTVVPSGGYSSGSANGVIKLSATYSGATIQQVSGTTLSGAAISATAYGGVSLTEANPTGIIAGAVTNSGDFKFESISSIKVDNVNGTSGINIAGGFAGFETSYGGAAFTQNAPIIASSGLVLVGTGSAQSVNLMNASNSFSMLSMNFASASTVEIMQGIIAGMSVGTVDAIAGLTLPGATKLKLVNANGAGSLTIPNGQPVTVGANAEVILSSGSGGISIGHALSAKAFEFAADGTISLSAQVSATDYAQFSNRDSPSFNVMTNCTGPCLSTNSFANISAPLGVVFGADDTHPTSTLAIGDAVSAVAFAGATKPGFIALLSSPGGSININAPITTRASDGHFVFSGGTVTSSVTNWIKSPKVSGKASSGALYFDGGDTAIASFTTPDSTPEIFGGITSLGSLTMNHTAGYGFTNGGGKIAATSLGITANYLGTSGTPLATQTPSLTFNATAGDAYITNNQSVPGSVSVGGLASGAIGFINYGITTVTANTTAGGTLSLTANSPLTVNSGVTVQSTGGSISLTAGSGGGLTINGTAFAPNGTVTANAGTLTGGGAIIDSSNPNPGITTTAFTLTSGFTNNTPAPQLPTLADCTANPSLSGCSTVLPTLATCSTTPTTPGCSAVLPALAVCTTTPTAPGCSAVLPSLDICTTAPTTLGCSAVLPTIDVCVTNPTAAGCSAVLPTLAVCTTTPTAPGCSAVLPPLASCTTTPTLPGCSAVLPGLDICTTAPTTAGCSAVLPPLASCTTTPSLPGCSVVLPSLATCTLAPATPGCSVVLPPDTQPIDQQLACLINPDACLGNGGNNETVNTVIENINTAQQLFTQSTQTGLTSSGTVDLALGPSGSGTGGGSGGSAGGAQGSTPGNSDEKKDDDKPSQQNGDTPPQAQGTPNASTPLRTCP